MKFRLAFSIAAINPCDILIIDEILTAGDFSFQVKTAKIIKQLQEKTNATTIIASHIPLFIFSFAEQFYQMKFGKLTKKTPSQTRKIVVNETNQWDKQFDYPK